MEYRVSPWLGWSQFVHRHLLWVLLGTYAVAAVFPAPGLWIGDVTLGDVSILTLRCSPYDAQQSATGDVLTGST